MHRFALAIILTAIMAGSAAADAIDGNWCSPDQERVHIDGSTIVTPGGNTITGNYSRHFFDYVVPEGEKGAGDAISMTQHSEELITVRRRPSGAEEFLEPVPWRRCKLIS